MRYENFKIANYSLAASIGATVKWCDRHKDFYYSTKNQPKCPNCFHVERNERWYGNKQT